MIDKEGLHLTEAKIKAIRDAPVNQPDPVKSLFGTTKFLQKVSTKSSYYSWILE